LLVSKTDLAGVVDLCSERGLLVELVLAPDAERRLILGRGPAQVDAGLQLRADLLVDGATEHLRKVNGCIDNRILKHCVLSPNTV